MNDKPHSESILHQLIITPRVKRKHYMPVGGTRGLLKIPNLLIVSDEQINMLCEFYDEQRKANNKNEKAGRIKEGA